MFAGIQLVDMTAVIAEWKEQSSELIHKTEEVLTLAGKEMFKKHIARFSIRSSGGKGQRFGLQRNTTRQVCNKERSVVARGKEK